MPEAPSGEVTELLARWRAGDKEAADELLPVVYAELRRLAALHLDRGPSDHGLGATALVHEAFLELVGQKRVEYQSRRHFYGLAVVLMRRILVRHARDRRALKRGRKFRRVPLREAQAELAEAQVRPDHLLAVDEALSALQQKDVQLAQVVELRFFGGLTNQEVADFMEISVPTVIRKWRLARAWLFRFLSGLPEL